MQKVVAITLVRDTPDLARAMRRALPHVLVFDNGSRPPIPGAWARLEENRYFTGGWNAAMRLVRDAEWAWMLNSDVTGVSPRLLQELVTEAEVHKCVAISPMVPGCNHPQMLREGRVEWLDWVAPVVRVDWFLAADGFDERFLGWGADIDLCARAPGLKRVSRRAVRHAWGATAKRLNDSAMYDAASARKLLREIHGPGIDAMSPEFF